MTGYIQELIEKWLTRNEVEIPKVEVDSSDLPDGAATEATLAAVQAAVETLDDIVSGDAAKVIVDDALPAGTNVIGYVGLDPRSSGGLSIFRTVDLDETEEEVKGSAGQIYGMIIFNENPAAERYIKIYNAPAASVTVGTTTPVITIPLHQGDVEVFDFPHGLAFSSGITVAATTGLADADTGAPGANEIVMHVFYE